MSYVKYTKTSTFLFPLLEIPKSLFRCSVKNVFGSPIMNTRFLNSYLIDSDVDKKEYNNGPYIYVVVKNYRDIDFDKFYEELISLPNYEDSYEKLDFIIFIFRIPKNFMKDYILLRKGMYSKITEKAKKIIKENAFFSGKSFATVSLILDKSPKLRKSWEKRLSTDKSFVSLEGQEVWGILEEEKETFSTKLLKYINEEKEKEK